MPLTHVGINNNLKFLLWPKAYLFFEQVVILSILENTTSVQVLILAIKAELLM